MVKYIDKNLVLSKFPERDVNSNKGTFGKILNIAGSKQYIGAAYLSSLSPLKIGAGFVSLAAPEELIFSIVSMAPEITFIPLKSTDKGIISSDNIIENINDYNVISMGCGLTVSDETSKFLLNTFRTINKHSHIVVDADAINIIALNKEVDFCLKNAVLTPHPMELSRLLSVPLDEIVDNREKYARITSQKYECITVLKGHETIVTNGEDLYINTTGSSALVKAGTGDVLTGMISGLLSQKLSPIDAALCGVFLHGLSGDIAADSLSLYSVLASDVIDYIPLAINELFYKE